MISPSVEVRITQELLHVVRVLSDQDAVQDDTDVVDLCPSAYQYPATGSIPMR